MAEPLGKVSRDDVVRAIERWFPSQWFSRFAREPGWSAQKLFWMAVLVPFAAMNEVVSEIAPRA